MLGFIFRRIIATIPVMGIVALFVFSLLYIAPGDPAVVIAGDQATPQDVERIRVSLGLDRPFVERFAEWSWRILHADLGTSMFTGMPVTQLIGKWKLSQNRSVADRQGVVAGLERDGDKAQADVAALIKDTL